MSASVVTPAKAGAQTPFCTPQVAPVWAPAYAGVTVVL
jgi:hypothetical protein